MNDIDWRGALLRVVVAYDTEDSLEFLAAMTTARKHLGLKLSDEREVRDDAEVLRVNGYTEDGEPVRGERVK